ncbi:MAG: hypothetical protein ABSC76_11935 [Terracidiphilus sp.]|jgi:hypothetical protein
MTGFLPDCFYMGVTVGTGSVTVGVYYDGQLPVTTWQVLATPDASDPTEGGTLLIGVEECDFNCPPLATTAVQIVNKCTAPTISSVTPDGWWAGQNNQNITINGGCFLTSSDTGGPSNVTLTDGAKAVTLYNISVASSSQITATVNVSKKAPAETVALTVTNPSSSGVPGTATASPAPVVLPMPVITWRNRTISGDTAQNKNPSVVVGQPVELTTTPATLPGGFTINQSTWDVPAANILSYSGDNSGITINPNVDLQDTKTTFYWLYPDTGLNVTYDYCATDPSGNQLCTSPQATATFKATRPNIKLDVTNPYNYAKVNELPACGQKKQKLAWMFYGDLHYRSGCAPPYTGPVGIELTPSGGDGGTYTFVQVLPPPGDTLSWGGKKPFQCGPYVSVLDHSYPFPGVRPIPPAAPTMAYDGPGQSLPNIYSSGTRNFHAVMYLLWQPPQLSGTGTPSIPVPIGYQAWQFGATADQDNPVGDGKWQQPTTNAAGAVGGFIPSTDADNAIYGYPVWGGTSGIASCDPVNQTEEINE